MSSLSFSSVLYTTSRYYCHFSTWPSCIFT